MIIEFLGSMTTGVGVFGFIIIGIVILVLLVYVFGKASPLGALL